MSSKSSKKKQAGAELKNNKRFFWAKILIEIELKGHKLTNFQKKKKMTFRAKKNKLGLSLKRKKGFLGQKLGKN